ncbi:COG1470 family protein [Symbiobacterium terraclitae]|uniref:COG1470 family protein n=1 Tax=Symbiobacterium terraclitae TaxID=557451 RepID=UPI0035B50813
MSFRIPRWGIMLATAALVLLYVAPPAAAAALTFSTRYPGIVVKPGEQLTLTLNLSGGAGVADLAVVELPEGWEQPTFRGSGYPVNQVYVAPDSSETVTLNLPVPERAAEGTYRVVLAASSGGEVARLPLSITVAATATGRASMKTDFPSIQAQAGTTYTFTVNLRNEGDMDEMFALTATPPQGWEVTFNVSGKQVGTIPVEANSSQSISVSVKVPEELEAGTYTVPVYARSGSAEASLDLELEVLGKYGLQVTTPDGRLSFDAVAGRKNGVTLEVKNTGTSPVTNINFSSTLPPNWSATFSPESIDSLAPGESRQVTVEVTPNSKALAGDYLLTLRARSGDSRAVDSADFRVAVQTPTLWGLAGIGVLAAVGGGLYWVFRTFGRR